jgi:hypothetical protein
LTTVHRAPISMGSPRGVPVPCISMPPSSEAGIPPLCKAARMTSCCEGPLGAVRLLERPSCTTGTRGLVMCQCFPMIRVLHKTGLLERKSSINNE